MLYKIFTQNKIHDQEANSTCLFNDKNKTGGFIKREDAISMNGRPIPDACCLSASIPDVYEGTINN